MAFDCWLFGNLFSTLAVLCTQQRVDHKLASLDDQWGVPLGAAHDCVDTRHQLVLMERLGHVVVGAEAKALDLVLDAGHPGQDQNRGLDLGDAQRAQHLVAGHVG